MADLVLDPGSEVGGAFAKGTVECLCLNKALPGKGRDMVGLLDLIHPQDDISMSPLDVPTVPWKMGKKQTNP